MLITSATCLFILTALLQGLRHPIYALHVLLVCAAAWGIQQSIPDAPAIFSPKAFENLLILHLPSITLLTFFLYWWDKRAATYSQRRIPERTLHAFAFVGGSLGALAGQKIFRHKTKKASFQLWFLLTFMLQIGVLLFLMAIS